MSSVKSAVRAFTVFLVLTTLLLPCGTVSRYAAFSGDAHDSLGEAYVTKGDSKNAIANFKKSLSMDPPANVKANSEKFLKQLGAL